MILCFFAIHRRNKKTAKVTPPPKKIEANKYLSYCKISTQLAHKNTTAGFLFLLTGASQQVVEIRISCVIKEAGVV